MPKLGTPPPRADPFFGWPKKGTPFLGANLIRALPLRRAGAGAAGCGLRVGVVGGLVGGVVKRAAQVRLELRLWLGARGGGGGAESDSDAPPKASVRCEPATTASMMAERTALPFVGHPPSFPYSRASMVHAAGPQPKSGTPFFRRTDEGVHDPFSSR